MDAGSRERAARREQRIGGFTLIEVSIVLAIIGIVTAATLPTVNRYFENGRGRAAAKSVADAFSVARAQAIRTGNNHVVFFSIAGAGDTAGTALTDADGDAAPILILNDGRPGSANQNCEIDAGEETITFEAQRGVGWGNNGAPAAEQAPDDLETTIPANGSSFRLPNAGAFTTWVQFRPDGVPVAIDNACAAGRLGSGGGTIYLWTVNRDYAVTMSPLGAVRVHTWNPAAGEWTL